jgi:hypothetical protein
MEEKQNQEKISDVLGQGIVVPTPSPENQEELEYDSAGNIVEAPELEHRDEEMEQEQEECMMEEEIKEDHTQKDESPQGSIPIEQRFLTRGAEYLEEVTDADQQYKELVDLDVMSAMLERFRIQESTTEGGKQLNLWAMPYGEARETHKTTVIDRITKRVEAVEERNHAFILLGDEMTLQGLTAIDRLLNPKTKKNKNDKSMPEPPPEVLKQIEEEEKRKYKVLFWNVDEAGGIISEMNNKLSYLRGLTHMLSKLYGGAKYVRITQMHGYEKLDSPYLTILLTGTPQMPKSLGIEAFETGFAVRFIYYCIRKAPNRPKPQFMTKQGFENQDFYENYLSALYQVKDYIPVYINVSAREMLESFVNSKYDEIKKALDKEETLINRLTKIYYGNLENLTERLGGIYAINRTITLDQLEKMGQPNFKTRGEHVTILKYDIEKAIDFIERVVLVGLKETLHLVASHNTTDLKIESDKNLFDSIVELLKSSKVEKIDGTIINNAIQVGELHRKIGLRYFRFKETISAMENMGYIRQEYGVQLKRGAPAIIVALKVVPQEEKVDVNLDSKVGGK